ncbi:MAG: tandem-95 repeat protein, partial [Nitrospira sp.]
QTSGTAGTKVSTASNGGTTAFSSATDTIDVSVSAVNDSPTVGAGSVTAIAEDTINPLGQSISSMIGGSFSDPDAGASLAGVLITNNPLSGAQGSWQYSTDGGSNWHDVGAIAYPNALALSASSYIRFLPATDYNGSPDILSFRGLDNTYSGGFTSGATKVTFDASSPGGNSPISSSLVNFSTTITAVNDAPVLADTALTLTVAEDAGVPSGTVGSLISAFTGGITDADSGAAKGIAITGTNETNGTWYYTTNGGTTWTAVGSVSNTSALLLADNASTRLYFAPGADYNGTSSAALTLRAWDQTSGTAGTKVTTATNGGTTAFSSATDTIDVIVSAVNDAPVNTVPGAQTTNKDSALVFSSDNGNTIAISDVDAASGSVQVTLTVTNGTLTLSGTTGLSFSTGDGIGDATMTFTGTVVSINTALNGLSFSPTTGYTGSATLQIVTNDQGNTGTGGALSDTDVVAISVTSASLWMSSNSNATSSAGSGGLSWTDGEVVNFGDPNLALGAGTTAGTFTNVFDLDTFTGDGNSDMVGLHHVGQTVVVGGGANTITLQAGDVLLAVGANETLGGLAVTKNDIVLFRPTTPGNYSSGTFSILLQNPTAKVVGDFALVEHTTVVGGTTLQAGSFLIAEPNKTDLDLFVSTGAGAGTTSGTLTAKFVDGAAINISQGLGGVELIQQTVTLGGVTLTSGQLLLSVDTDDSTVGDNSIAVKKDDIFKLDLTATGSGTTAGTASQLFVGANVGISAGGEEFDAIALVNSTSQAPVMALPGSAVTYTENAAPTVIDATATVTDADSANFSGGVLVVDFSANGTTDDRLAIQNQGTGAGQIGVSGSSVTYGGVTIGTFTGGTDGSTPLVVTLNSSATPAAVQALARNITYANVSDAPSTVARTVRFVVTDGDGGTSTAVTETITVTAVNDAPVLADTALSITVAEDAGAPSGAVGSTISAFTGGITDVDASAVKGIAITGTNETNGTWYYTTNGGTTWTAVGTVSNTSALLLADNASTRLYFAPAADYNGTSSSALTLRAWDQTSGTAGTKVTTASNGGTTAFSSATDTIDVTVTALNDAPVFTVPPGTTSYTEGATVFVTPSATLTDVDSSDFNGGQLALSITSGGENTDRLYVNSQGTGPGQVFASGANVFYNNGGGSIQVGTISGGYGSSDPLVITFNSSSTSAAIAAITSQVLFWNTSENPAASSRTITLQVTDGDGGTSALQTRTISMTPVNDAPTITSLSGDSLSYNEGDGAVVIEQGGNALVADVDSIDFNSGTLTVSFTAGSDSAEDVLGVRNQGTGAGQIGVSGSNIAYGGTVIGTYTGGSGGTNLVITLNSNATPTAVTALVKNITYENTDTAAPATGARTVRFVLTDGGGGTSANYDTTVTVSGVNDAPVVTPIAPDVTFVEGGTAQLIDATGTITDVDSSNFDGGVMTISISANGTADDRLMVGNWGVGPGQVGVSGSDVTYGGTVIGTVSGGTSGSDPLVITFNTSATPSAVQEIYRSIQFNNVSENPSTATRTLTIDLTDGDGGTATPQTKLVYVQATNDVPVLTFGEGDKNFTEDGLAVMIDVLPTVSDLDSTNFDTGTLTITISANPSVDDRVELLNTGMGAGQIGVSGTNVYYGGTLIGTQTGGIGAVPFVVTFNADADASIVGEVMANIRFWVAGDTPSTATRTIEAVLTDGDGGTSLTASKQITVTAVNDPTIITGGTSGSGAEDTTITNTLTATDAEGLADGTVFTVSTGATNGTASIDPATGLWSYQPNADWHGSDSFTVTITDDAGNTATQVISVTVTPVVDITDDSLTTTEDTAISANVLTGTNGATADNFEGTPVLTSVTQGANGSVTFLANGTVTYTPTANFNGTDSFTYTITSGGVTETATVTVNVTAVNDPTIITGGTSGSG